MGQRANIINRLRMMGYTVTNETDQDYGVICIGLSINNDHQIHYWVGIGELLYNEFIIEHIVSNMNRLMVDSIRWR